VVEPVAQVAGQRIAWETSVHGGFVPPPLLVMENWFQMVGDMAPILRALGIEAQVSLDVPAKNQNLTLPIFKDFSSFMAHESFQAFAALSTSSDEAYLTILPKITCNLLASLQESGVHQAFDAASLQPLLQFCYQRMLCGMHHAVNGQTQFLKFLNQINLIHEEIATLLAVVEPYKIADFDALMQQTLQPAHRYHGIEPQFYFKNSGMSCLRSALGAMEELKASVDPTGSSRLRIGVVEGNYFENTIFSSVADFHDLGQEPTSTQKLDVCVGHFRPSCDSGASCYVPQNMTAQIDQLFANGLVAPHLLVVIDNTISLTGESTLYQFVANHQQRIEDQSLSVVEVRSLQKTAQAGFDMYAGGSVAVYSRCAPLRQAFAAQDGQTVHSLGNLQGIMHFEKTLGPELDERRMAIVRTARRLNTPGDDLGFPQYMQASSRCEEPIQVVPNDDPQSPFVHLRLNNRFVPETGDYLAAHLARKAAREPEKFPLTQRDSFGFNQTSLADFGTHTRLSPGLEPEVFIRNYRDYVVLLNDVLHQAMARFPNQQEALMAQVLEHGDGLLGLIERCRGDAQLEATPQTQKALHKAWDEVIFPL
jgi:hypothetical protein